MTAFDLDGYLKRIAFAASPRPDLATLAAVHRAHAGSIPFENLDIQMGRRISLDPETLQAKIVSQRRGGYCFEQNTLFALALDSIGFTVDSCEARVRQQTAGVILPRTHMVLRVVVEERPWLADVGFGGDGLIEPIAFDAGPARQLGVDYRIARDGRLSVLQRQIARDWEDLYAVLPEPVYPIDFEVGNWFTSTHPRSPFVLNLTAQRITRSGRHILRNLTYTVVDQGGRQTREIARGELAALLRDVFGLDVPPEARFRALDT